MQSCVETGRQLGGCRQAQEPSRRAPPPRMSCSLRLLLAAALIAGIPTVPALKAAWLESYQASRPLSAQDIEMLDSMVMLRRMALLAWIGSHCETSLAQTHVDGFAEGTMDLARRYLSGAIWP